MTEMPIQTDEKLEIEGNYNLEAPRLKITFGNRIPDLCSTP